MKFLSLFLCSRRCDMLFSYFNYLSNNNNLLYSIFNLCLLSQFYMCLFNALVFFNFILSHCRVKFGINWHYDFELFIFINILMKLIHGTLYYISENIP